MIKFCYKLEDMLAYNIDLINLTETNKTSNDKMINEDQYIVLHSDARLFSSADTNGDCIQHHQEEGNRSPERQNGQLEQER